MASGWASVAPAQAPTPAPNVGASVGGYKTPKGDEVQLDLPHNLHIRNRGGSDGVGLCVFASMAHAGTWANEPVFAAIFDYMKRHPGGGWPEKVNRTVAQYCKEKGVQKPRYLQVEGADLEILKTACERGYMPSVTYCYSPTGRYGGRRISHMVTLLHAKNGEWGVLDNNYPGSVEWLNDSEFRETFTCGRSGWAIILLDEGPPPIPRNYTVSSLPTGVQRRDPGYKWLDQCLFYKGRQIGYYKISRDEYLPFDGTRFGKPCNAPVPYPKRTNYGVFGYRLRDGYYSLSGRKVSRDVARQTVAALPDHSGKLQVVVVGSENDRQEARRAIDAIEDVENRAIVHYYTPTHWHVKGLGYERGLSILTPDGIELHRQNDFGGDVRRAMESSETEWLRLRRRNPKYDPLLTPDRRKLFDFNVPWSIYVLLGGAALLFLVRRK